MIRNTALSVLVAALAATATVAYAAKGNGENDALAVAQAKVSIVQAIAAAEQHAGGKAAKVEFEHGRKGVYYEVEVVSGAKVFDVKVDADSGAVISATEDEND
ncbi:MAG: PepSY domain-containing protein [Burkholderiales bacterium]|nr:PepSY domain-containing protein [Burkholderiales bacterium]